MTRYFLDPKNREGEVGKFRWDWGDDREGFWVGRSGLSGCETARELLLDSERTSKLYREAQAAPFETCLLPWEV